MGFTKPNWTVLKTRSPRYLREYFRRNFTKFSCEDVYKFKQLQAEINVALSSLADKLCTSPIFKLAQKQALREFPEVAYLQTEELLSNPLWLKYQRAIIKNAQKIMKYMNNQEGQQNRFDCKIHLDK